MKPEIELLGDSAIAVRLGSAIDEATRIRVRNAAASLEAAALPGVVDIVPAFVTVTLHCNLKHTTPNALVPLVEAVLSTIGDAPSDDHRQLRIPVCYGEPFGPDLDSVAAAVGMSASDIVLRHTANEYRVYTLGFLPGFAYLGGLDPAIEAPRRSAPRERVPAGSVAIGGLQTGIYPLESPGGWQLIGRTPCRIFDPSRDPPVLLRPGDRVRFDAIAPEAFDTAEVVIS